MRKLKLGDSELELLRFVARHPGGTVREASDHFAASKGWTRTTVLKTLDRLREKGLVEREEVEGIFQYRSTSSEEELEQALVHQFFTQSMEGSLKGFVAYLQNHPELTKEELSELRKLVDRLEDR